MNRMHQPNTTPIRARYMTMTVATPPLPTAHCPHPLITCIVSLLFGDVLYVLYSCVRRAKRPVLLHPRAALRARRVHSNQCPVLQTARSAPQANTSLWSHNRNARTVYPANTLSVQEISSVRIVRRKRTVQLTDRPRVWAVPVLNIRHCRVRPRVRPVPVVSTIRCADQRHVCCVRWARRVHRMVSSRLTVISCISTKSRSCIVIRVCPATVKPALTTRRLLAIILPARRVTTLQV